MTEAGGRGRWKAFGRALTSADANPTAQAISQPEPEFRTLPGG